jgi:hypothetical protein
VLERVAERDTARVLGRDIKTVLESRHVPIPNLLLLVGLGTCLLETDIERAVRQMSSECSRKLPRKIPREFLGEIWIVVAEPGFLSMLGPMLSSWDLVYPKILTPPLIKRVLQSDVERVVREIPRQFSGDISREFSRELSKEVSRECSREMSRESSRAISIELW